MFTDLSWGCPGCKEPPPSPTVIFILREHSDLLHLKIKVFSLFIMSVSSVLKKHPGRPRNLLTVTLHGGY